MAAELTYLGHSAVLLSDGSEAVAVDPFLSGNELAVHQPGDIKCGTIALTHGHEDHVGDTIPIAMANDATVVAVFELCNALAEQGVSVDPGNPGGTVPTAFGDVTFVQAFHSSSYQGRYMGQPCGLIIRIGGATVYHCGDTALFSDMALIGEIYKPDVALIPIGDRFTMGPTIASRAAELIKPGIAIPIHYKTFGLLVQSADGFEPKGVEVKVMDPGDKLSI